ncbi:hypothetical protein ACFQ09_19050 [Massilia norwichensis]|uniref:Uncharacterized protein n=1 Tax=Massilia norwichensis TaxID=1442366 RepID=A0ABT2A889_9BURK|nr:hypothetical protein [Massilia norwichensis]MCS0590420.1 hypothetical protein [Massilia norwichensis]
MSTSSTSPADPEFKTTNNRWWEVYIIRYFVGTVIGGAVLLYLNNAKTSRLSNLILPGVTDISKLDMQLLILLGAMGLAFCYISSAPILVLHASRAAFLREDRTSFNWILGGSCVLILIAATGFRIFSSFNNVDILSTTALALVIFVQAVPLTFSLLKNGEISHKYYTDLTKARTKTDLASQEYKESYRHLREHGNAFLIVFFEAVLGIVLVAATSADMAAIVLICWILPAALIWVHGSVLEYRFSKP